MSKAGARPKQSQDPHKTSHGRIRSGPRPLLQARVDKMTVERTAPTAIRVTSPVAGEGWEQWFLLRSDAHHDNVHCNQDLEREHLELARERNAGILDFGDAFCAMQGKWDPRADPEQLRPEYRGKNYLDLLVDQAHEFYRPYAQNFLLLSRGNHETSIIKRHQTDLTERLVGFLRAGGNSQAQVGSYQGWVWFHFKIGGTQTVNFRLRYTHGYGGGGPVTRDVIQTARQSAILQNADIVVSGHTHDSWHLPLIQERLNAEGIPERRVVHFIKPGSYKDEFSAGDGWAVEKGHPPKPLGASWLRFYRAEGTIKLSVSVDAR